MPGRAVLRLECQISVVVVAESAARFPGTLVLLQPSVISLGKVLLLLIYLSDCGSVVRSCRTLGGVAQTPPAVLWLNDAVSAGGALFESTPVDSTTNTAIAQQQDQQQQHSMANQDTPEKAKQGAIQYLKAWGGKLPLPSSPPRPRRTQPR